MSQPFSNIFIRLFSVLKDSPSVQTLVNEKNIRQYDDPAKPEPGCAIVYGWNSAVWDKGRRRGTGQLEVNCLSPKNKAEAASLGKFVDAILTAGGITGDAKKIRVAQIKQTSGTDAGQSAAEYWQYKMIYDVKVLEGSERC